MDSCKLNDPLFESTLHSTCRCDLLFGRRGRLTYGRYALFHPLGFLVKLNIEMIMANLIRRIALSDKNSNTFLLTFASANDGPDSKSTITEGTHRHSRWIRSIMPKSWREDEEREDTVTIVKTEEYEVVSRRRSQMSGQYLGRWGSQRSKRQSLKRESGSVLGDVSVGSGEIIDEDARESIASEQQERASASVTGDEVGSVRPPSRARTRILDNS